MISLVIVLRLNFVSMYSLPHYLSACKAFFRSTWFVNIMHSCSFYYSKRQECASIYASHICC